MSNYELYCGDCLEVLPGLEAKSVDCAVIDPPYFQIVNEDWDRQWASIEDYTRWIGAMIDGVKRTLKDNGSLYIFCDDKTAAYVQVEIDKRLLLLNNIVWYKVNNLPIKSIINLLYKGT